MQRREIIRNLRTSGKLKGVKPCMIYLKNNIGDIYKEGRADFVMSIKGDTLYFQKITTILRRIKPSDDFNLKISNFVEYTFISHTLYNTLCLYDEKKRFIEIHYNKGIADTYTTEDNIARIIKILEEKGIKEINLEKDIIGNEESNTSGEGTN